MAESMTPAERRDRAQARLAEIKGKIAALDRQIAAHDAAARALDAKVASAKAAVAKAAGTLAGSTSALRRAQAVHLTAQDTEGESAAAAKVAEAEQARAAAQTAFSDTQGAAQDTTHEAAAQRQEIESARAEAQSERDELASLADALAEHANQAHIEAGNLAVSELAGEIAAAERALSAAEADAAAKRQALMALRQSVPGRLAAWKGLSSRDDAVVLRDTGLTRAAMVTAALIEYMQALDTCAGAVSPTIGQQSLRLAVHSLDERTVDLLMSRAGEGYRGLIRPKLAYAREVAKMIAKQAGQPSAVRADLVSMGNADVVPSSAA